LDEEGRKLPCETPKRSYGVIKGSSAPLHVGGNIYALAEGVETGLSVATANKNLTVFSSLGSMTNFSRMQINAHHNTIILFEDHDKDNPETSLKVNKAADELHQQGFNVLRCKPKAVGHDFNDVLRARGIEGVKQEITQLTIHVPSQEKGWRLLNKEPTLNRAKKYKREQELER
jgi:hypothetical protein